MAAKDAKVTLWIGDAPNQRALANRIASTIPLSGIIIEKKSIAKKKRTLTTFVNRLLSRLLASQIGATWKRMNEFYSSKYPNYPKVEIVEVANINSKTARSTARNMNADLVLVSGTRMIKKRMLDIRPKVGILNLHTGLSPYVKGGPNCTNWCLAKGNFHLIGNTIMWIDSGIDTGNIISTEFTCLDKVDSFYDLHLAVMDHAHNLYARSALSVLRGNRTSIDQSSLGVGTTFYTKEWNVRNQVRAVQNFQKLISSIRENNIFPQQERIKTVPLVTPPQSKP